MNDQLHPPASWMHTCVHEQEQPGAARSSQEQSEAARSSQKQPEAARSSQEQPGGLARVCCSSRAQLERLWGEVLPCVSYAVLNTWLNGWGTSARFQIQGGCCWLHADCHGSDAIEHYAVCDCHWDALTATACISPPWMLASFLLLTEDSEARLRVRACHVFAVRNTVNVRKAEGRRKDRQTVLRLIGAGHKTARLAGRSLAGAYRDPACPRKIQQRQKICTGCDLEMFECNCPERKRPREVFCTGCGLEMYECICIGIC